MRKSLICLLLLSVVISAAPRSGSIEAFKKEMTPLQSAVDSSVLASESQVMRPSKAAYLDGYGVVVVLEISFERPRGPFGSAETPAQVRAIVEQRKKALETKLSDLLKARIGKTDAVGASESIAIIVHILNSNPADVPDLPIQLVLSIKKDAPAQVAIREL